MIELKTGMFGVTDDGDEFVVVGDKIVYKSGTWQSVEDAWDTDGLCYKILRVYNDVPCFNSLHNRETGYKSSAIYDAERPVEMTLDEVKCKLGVKNLIIKM